MPVLRRHRFALLATVLSALAGAVTARADVVPIDVVARGQNRLLMDGVLGDWRRFTQLLAVDEEGQVQQGRGAWRGADDASFGFALARDDQALYVAAEVHDDQVVRSREHRAHDDAIVVTLAVPAGPNRTVAYDLVLYPGDPGNYAGAVRLRGARAGAVAGAQVVEAPLRGGSGFTLEAAIPWRAIPEIHAGIAGLRGRVAYQDADSHATPSVDTVLATGPGDAAHPGDLPGAVGAQVSNPAEMIAQFQQSQGLVGTEPFLDRSANVAGDAALERVVIYPRFVVVAGPGIAGGTRYAYVEYPLRSREDLLEPALRDLTGDGRQDVILRLRVAEPNGLQREVLYVYGAPNGGDSLTRIFGAELGRAQGGNRVANRATYEGGGRIRITFESGAGYTEANYPRATEPGVVAALTPWGEHRVVVYRWSDAGQRFEVERTEPNPNARVAAGTTPPAVGTATSPAMVQAPADLNAVLRTFRQQRGIPETARPSFSLQGNVSGDATPETVQLYDRVLVVTGPRFMNGRSFYNIELPEDLEPVAMELADVTADGRAEAIVRARRQRQAQVRGRTIDITSEYVIVYSIDDAHRGRVFLAEVARRAGDDAITNVVRPLPRGQNGELVIEAGRASGGWNPQTYPFRDAPSPGIAPLLLPWDATRVVRYRWNGTALAPAP